jgi:hypothetical protein
MNTPTRARDTRESTMSDAHIKRSIAEIIGWTENPDFDPYHPGARVYTNGKETWSECPDCLVGTTWQVNDSKRRFTVVRVQAQYAYVKNDQGTERRILAASLRTSGSKTGYTQLRAVAGET